MSLPGCESMLSSATGPGLVSVSPAGVTQHGVGQMAQCSSSWLGVAQLCYSSHSGHAPPWSLPHQDRCILVPGSLISSAHWAPNLFTAAEITTFPPSSLTAALCHSPHTPKLTLDLSLLQTWPWMTRAAAALCSLSWISGEPGAF